MVRASSLTKTLSQSGHPTLAGQQQATCPGGVGSQLQRGPYTPGTGLRAGKAAFFAHRQTKRASDA